ncbi:MAG: LruC domain-containing protein [Prevotella sp.]|nr:LruC domain-containing protein [Prevotella sp.]
MKTFMQKLNPALWITFVFAMAFSACSEDLGLAGSENGENSEWPLKSVDPKQTWMTSETVQLDISIDDEADITAQTIMNENVTILGQKHLKGSGVMFLDVPQGIGNSFGLVYDDGVSPKQYRQINLTGYNAKVIDVNFQSESATRGAAPAPQRASTRAATASSLYGKSILEDCGYLNFGPWGWGDVKTALVESKNSKDNLSTLIDYEIKTNKLLEGGELLSNNDIVISFLYGHTGQTGARTLGYYYHSKETYNDIVFQDIAEVLTLDYYNGKAKVQYQLDNKPEWYDANFDYRDDPAKPTQSPANSVRKGDDAWNTLNVNEYYGDRVTAIRGITFKLSIPKGMEFGFYLRTNGALSSAQKTILKNLGVSESNMPQYSANYSCANMNTGSNNFRSAIAIYDNFTFMGLDDDLGGGDYDCNDVTFALSNSKGEPYIPYFTESTENSKWNKDVIDKHPEYITPPTKPQLQSWTLAFENAGMDNDFDFNDVVLKVTPNTSTHTEEVKLLATGAKRKTEVYYNGTLLGEVHDLFGVDTKTMVNTTSTKATKKAVTLNSIDWPENATMETQRMNFSLKVYNEDGTLDREFSMTDLLNNQKSPQALCMAGDWKWPKERKNIHTAYPLIGLWGVNFNNSEYGNWYAYPKEDAVVTPLSE